MVASPRKSWLAISRLDRPRATWMRTSVSRGVRSGSARGALCGRPPGEFGDQPPGHRWGEQRVAAGDGGDARDERVGRGVFQQESAGPRPQRLEDVFIKVVGGQHEHLDTGGPGQPAGRLDPVQPRHPDVHQDDVGCQLGGPGYRLRAVGGFPDDGDGVLGVKELAEAGPDKFLVVGDEHPDRHGTAWSPASTGSLA